MCYNTSGEIRKKDIIFLLILGHVKYCLNTLYLKKSLMNEVHYTSVKKKKKKNK